MERHRVIAGLCWIASFLFFFSGASWAGQSTVSGLVLDADDLKPAAGVTIVLEDVATGITTSTDTGGRYLFQGISPGEYTLHVSSPEYLNVPKPITVSEDLCTTVNLGAIPVDVLEQIQEESSAGREDTTAVQTWKGTWRDDEGEVHRGKLTLKANFSGNSFRGTMIVTKAFQCGTLTLPCSGTLSGNEFHMQIRMNNRCTQGKLRLVFDGTLSPSATKITGTIDSFKGRRHANHYTFIIRKQ